MGNGFIRFERKTTEGSRDYLASRSAKWLLLAEGEVQVGQAFREVLTGEKGKAFRSKRIKVEIYCVAELEPVLCSPARLWQRE